MQDDRMEVRSLGTQGLMAGCIGLGCMGMSEFYGAATEEEATSVIHHALDRGLTLLDTSDMYGSGANEVLVGTALRGRREDAVLATKFGIMRGPQASFLGVNGKPEYVKAACEASLRRLQVEAIDLYYQHRVDPEVPIEDTVGAMADLKRQGKIRHLGLSEASVETIERAHAVHPISALQTEYSLWTRDVEDGILATIRRLGIGLVAYSPLGRGFLAGKIRRFEDLPEDDYRRTTPRFQGENFVRNLEVVDRVEEIARRKGIKPSQLALAWVLAQGRDIVPIPGTKKIHYLDENADAAAVTLSPDDLAEIAKVLPSGKAHGERYTPASLAAVNR